MSASGTGHPAITAALAILAARRQATIGGETLDLFSADLTAEPFAVDVVVEACERIGRSERAEGETAFPSLGTLLRVCRQVVTDRAYQRIVALAATAPDVPVFPEPTRDEARTIGQRFRDRVAALRKAGA